MIKLIVWQDNMFKSYFFPNFQGWEEEAVIGKQTPFSLGSPETTGHNANKFLQPKRKVVFVSSGRVLRLLSVIFQCQRVFAGPISFCTRIFKWRLTGVFWISIIPVPAPPQAELELCTDYQQLQFLIIWGCIMSVLGFVCYAIQTS